ncbi:hypothetical protein BS47DRAFT_1362141 [Hydnum rufescens UP504]|uniref:Uncharacterized protein n=1 Tax=Hydnum rufescens UP504 TaxID=1448309 RepID=A0A9P6DWN3_9AGAM|nr:hypothetical protein BS47DRAFT_1362141 [Hydnum rufescens UP504]
MHRQHPPRNHGSAQPPRPQLELIDNETKEHPHTRFGGCVAILATQKSSPALSIHGLMLQISALTNARPTPGETTGRQSMTDYANKSGCHDTAEAELTDNAHPKYRSALLPKTNLDHPQVTQTTDSNTMTHPLKWRFSPGKTHPTASRQGQGKIPGLYTGTSKASPEHPPVTTRRVKYQYHYAAAAQVFLPTTNFRITSLTEATPKEQAGLLFWRHHPPHNKKKYLILPHLPKRVWQASFYRSRIVESWGPGRLCVPSYFVLSLVGAFFG